VERSCSFAGTAHRTALCRAIESATNTTLAGPARLTRVLFLETERILARLWNLGMTAQGFGLAHLWETAQDQREDLFVALESGTGNRRYWGVAVPGGVRGDLDAEPLRAALERLDAAIAPWRVATGPQGALGRAGKGVAALSEERATALGLTGLAAYGSAAVSDLRRDERDTGYDELDVDWPALDVKSAGDIAGRLAGAVEEMATSLAIARKCLGQLPASAEPSSSMKPLGRDARLSATIEGPHGPVTLSARQTATGTLADFHLETPAAATLAALPELLEGRQLGQVAATLASLDLCAECLDQ
jgi:Ni,Fe-hydrogenase III large subunit